MRGQFAGLGRERNKVYLVVSGERRDYDLHDRCAVSVNGQPCLLEDLYEGDVVSVDGRPAVALKAERASDKPLPPKRVGHNRGWSDDGRGYETPKAVTSPALNPNVDQPDSRERYLPPPVATAKAGAGTDAREETRKGYKVVEVMPVGEMWKQRPTVHGESKVAVRKQPTLSPKKT